MPNAELYKFSDFCSENKVRAETAEMSSQRIRNQRFLEFFFYFIICVSIYVSIQLQAQK